MGGLKSRKDYETRMILGFGIRYLSVIFRGWGRVLFKESGA